MTGRPESVAASALEPGTMVGEYRITKQLGEGGMGVVYAGLHPEIGKQVAIKVLSPLAAAHPARARDLIRRFKEEARAVNKIKHPNIIDIFAFNQLPDGRHYFVMEYLDGEGLTKRMANGPMEFGEMRRLLGQICSALEAAHQAGVVHRDLKPDNIWVATQTLSESRIKLLDFGIAKLNDLTNSQVTQSGAVMGTPQYMAPEQAMGRGVDERADIYALGVIMYEIFAGTVPFLGATVHEVVLKHVTEPPVPPSRHRPIVPDGIEAIILDCLKKEPERRPRTVRELGARIEAAFAQHAAAAKGKSQSTVPRLTSPPAPPPARPAPPPPPARPAPPPPPARPALPPPPARPAPPPPVGRTISLDTISSGVAFKITPDVRSPSEGKSSSRRWTVFAVSAAVLVIGVSAAAVLTFRRHDTNPPPRPPPLAAPPIVKVEPKPPVIVPLPHPPKDVSVTIKIDTVPSGAHIVTSTGEVLGRTPYAARRPRTDSPLAVRLEMDGYKPQELTFPLNADVDQRIALEKRPSRATSPLRRPSVTTPRPPEPTRPPATDSLEPKPWGVDHEQ